MPDQKGKKVEEALLHQKKSRSNLSLKEKAGLGRALYKARNNRTVAKLKGPGQNLNQQDIDGTDPDTITYGDDTVNDVNLPEPPQVDLFNLTLERREGLTVHIMPFSHVSDGLLAEQAQLDPELTVGPQEEGRENTTVLAGSADDIFASTIQELLAQDFHPNRSFTFADIKFFKNWYEKQNSEKKSQVKNLIDQGKLDLVGGAYVPPDQALNDVDAMLDNFMVGNEFLKGEFDMVPKVAWQLDDFGVSAGFTRLAQDLGLEMLIYQSASEQEKE